MKELIQSLSGTPLPTIFVIAGIFFVFISVGGRLGATVATDTVKKNIAGGVGGVLILVGVFLYFGSQVASDVMAPQKEQSLLAEKKYLLKPKLLPVGRIIETTEMSLFDNAKLVVQAPDGSVQTGFITLETESVGSEEILSSQDGVPTAIKGRIIKDVEKRRIKNEAGKETVEEVKGALSGSTILIEMNGGKWIKTLLGADPTKDQAEALREPYSDDSDEYPKEPISVGATWTIEGANIVSMLGVRNLLSVNGSATFHLERVEECGEDTCGVISLKRLEIEGVMLVDGEEARLKIGGEGVGLRSLTKFIDLKNSFDGVMSIKFDQVGGSNVSHVNMVGPISIKKSRKLISR